MNGEPPTSPTQFMVLLEQARAGNSLPLNQFFQQLYIRGKGSLLTLTQSESQAEECFQTAVAKFWSQCVEGKKALPKSNIEGYIYSIAKFHYMDELRKQHRSKTHNEDVAVLANQAAHSVCMVASIDQVDAEKLEALRRTVMHQMIRQLSPNCQDLFNAILEEGIDQPKQLMKHLKLKEVRRVSVLKYECYKRLRVLSAAALEVELLKK